MMEEWKAGSRFDPTAAKPKAGPCSRETRRCSEARSYRSDLKPCCRALIVEVMDHWAEVAESLDIAWWADYGTLLGAVRNQGIIPHDKDADIGMMGADWERLLDWRADEIPWKKTGASFRQSYSREIDGFYWTYNEPRAAKTNNARYEFTGGHRIKILASKLNHTNLDIFPWYLDGPTGNYYRKRYISIDRYKGRDFPVDKLLPLGQLEWEGRTIPGPADPEWFCRHRYGKRWETPIRANNDGVRR